MSKKTNRYGFLCTALLFLAVPLSLYCAVDTAERTKVKEVISVLTFVGLILMLGQFYLARTVKLPFSGAKIGQLRALHISLGYLGTAILLIHPLMIVAPRFFEAGISPYRAFETMITTDSPGVLTGIAAWIVLLMISILSILRNRIPFTYRAWRKLHGLMSAAFIILAAYHAIYLGRHMNRVLAVYIAVQVSVGLFFLIHRYISEISTNGEKEKWVLPEQSTICREEAS